jgi:O-antigen/teichoic acid export membrane protein
MIGRLALKTWGSQLARGSLFLLVGNIGSTVLSVAKSILIARALGAEVFGLVTYALTLAMFAAQFVDMRSGDTLVRFVGSAVVKKEPVKAATYFQLGVLIDMAAALVAVLAIGLIVLPAVGAHPQHALLQTMIRIYMWAVPLRLLRSPFNAILVTFKRFHTATILLLASRLAELGAVLLLLPLGAVALLWGLVFAAAFELLLNASCAAAVFWREARVWRGRDYRAAWREMRPFSVYGSLLGSLQSLTANLDVVALGALRPASEVGFYTIARSAASVLTTAVGPVSQVVVPSLNEAWAQGNKARVRQLIGRLMLVNATASVSAAVFLFFTARWLVVLFYGLDFSPAAPVLRLMIVFIGLQTVFGWMRRLILIAGFPRLDFVAGIIGTGFYLLLLVPFVAWQGAVGLAELLILDTLVMVSTFTWIVSRRVQLWGGPA